MVSTRRIAARRLSIASAGWKSSGGAWLAVVSWSWRWSDIVAPRLVRGPRGCRARPRRVCVRGGRACWFGGALGLRVLDPAALAGHLEDDRVVNEPVDRGGGGHRVFEDPFPLAEHEVAGDHHATALVTLGEEGEQALDERVGRDEQHAVPTLDQLVADGADQVGLAATRQTECEQIVAALEERALAQGRQHLGDLHRQARPGERRERLVGRQLRLPQVALDAAPAALVDLELDQVVEVAHERPALTLGELRGLLGMTRDGGELERAEQDHERRER